MRSERSARPSKGRIADFQTYLSSKKQYVWRFMLDGGDNTLEMFTSILSGKKKIVLNA